MLPGSCNIYKPRNRVVIFGLILTNDVIKNNHCCGLPARLTLTYAAEVLTLLQFIF